MGGKRTARFRSSGTIGEDSPLAMLTAARRLLSVRRIPLEYPGDVLTRVAATQRWRLSKGTLRTLVRLVDTVFFASMMIEEGTYARIAIVHNERGAAGLVNVHDESPGNEEDPPLAWDVTSIPQTDYDARILARLARGVAYGSQLIVVGGRDRFWIDGISRMRRGTDGGAALRIAAPRPGVVVFELGSRQLFRYEVGLHVPRHIDVVGENGPVRRALRAILGEAPDDRGATQIDGHTYYDAKELALLELVQKMRATGSGAILALLPTIPDAEVLQGVRYGRNDPMALSMRIQANRERGDASLFRQIDTVDKDLTNAEVHGRDIVRSEAEAAAAELESAIDDAAQLSAIDGAMLAGPGLAIYGAGYLIPSVQLEKGAVRRALNAEGDESEEYPSQHGARHAAGFAFAYQNEGAVAFIVSEDGPVRCAMRIGRNVMVWQVQVLET